MKPPMPEPPRKGRKREPREHKDRHVGWDEAGREGADMMARKGGKKPRDTGWPR